MKLNINKRFQNLLPALQADELLRLETSIRADGVRDPLVLWNDTIVDGHNRYDIATRYDIPFSTVGKSFENEDDACIWIIENQTGKRNLTDVQRTFQIGELYKLKKKKHGGTGANQYTKEQSPHNEDSAKTSEVIAREQNVSKATVERAADFHTAVTDIAEHTELSANDILELAEKTSKKDIEKIAKLPKQQMVQAVDAISFGEVKDYKEFERNEAKKTILAESKEAHKQSPPKIVIGDGIEWLREQSQCDLLLTDPPYSTDIDDIEAFANHWLPLALSKVVSTGCAYVFIGAYPNELKAYLNVKIPEHMTLTNVLVWHYKNTLGVTPKEKYNLDWQAILYYRGKDAPPINSPLTSEQRAVQEINHPNGLTQVGFHTWQKPDELAERFIRHSTKECGVVLDPFACTGTFLLAASRLGRVGLGAEIDEQHAKIAIERGCIYG